MPKRTDFTNWVEEQLAPLGVIRIKSMFGGFGIYADELFFAIIDDDVLFLKTDELNRNRFIEAGATPFTYPTKDGIQQAMSYHAVPDGALDDTDELLEWARLALDSAVRARAVKTKKMKKKS